MEYHVNSLCVQVDLPCSVSHHVDNYLGLTSITVAIIVPTVCGPVMAAVVHLVLHVLNRVRGQTNVAIDTRKLEIKNLACILALTLVFLPTYISSMILAELYLDINNIFSFVIVKYILGTVMDSLLTTNRAEAPPCRHLSTFPGPPLHS